MPQSLVFDQNYHLQRELRANETNADIGGLILVLFFRHTARTARAMPCRGEMGARE